jgi:hypothetical protein
LSSDCMKRQVVVAILLAATLCTPLLPRASATPIAVVSIDPDSGVVGTLVRMIGEIDTLGGSYEIWWDYQTLLKEGSCPAGSLVVDTTFTVPSSAWGVHYVDLYDSAADTYGESVQFMVLTSLYTLSMAPTRIQEGLNTTITVGVQGVAANTTYALTVTTTTPTGASYATDLTVTTDAVGSGAASTRYGGEFPGATTQLVGTYRVAVNESLATGNFTVGLTDKLVYGTTETVSIRGAGYSPAENVVVNIKVGEASVGGYPKNVMADMEGVVADSWSIPTDAAAGTYVVTVVSATTPGTVKEPVDGQAFSVRLLCPIQTRNLDDEPVSGLLVEVYNANTSEFLRSDTTNATGWVIFFLETDTCSFKAFWQDVEVGSLSNQSVSGALSRILEVYLAHIRLVVKDEANASFPLINVDLTYNYTTRYGETRSGTFPLETNSKGVAEVYPALTNISYAVEARRHGHLFNRTLIENVSSSLQVTIICPAYNLVIQVLDSKDFLLQNAQVTMIDGGSGTPLGTPQATDKSGSTAFHLPIGRYTVRVYNYSAELGATVVLNETIIDLIDDRFFEVHCRIFNVDLSVRVVGYFGQPISNAAVEFERDGVKIRETFTSGSTGVVLLQNVIGGDYRVSVYIGERLAGIQTFPVDQSMEILFKLKGYVALSGHTLEASQLISLISMSLLSAALVLLFTRRRLLLFGRRIREARSRTAGAS